MIAYFDMFSGISGDMTLGALVDLGVPLEWLKNELSSMPFSGFDIREEKIRQNGIRAVNLFVDADHEHHARDYAAIKGLISDSLLSDRVKRLSLAAFEKIAVAESRIHGTDIERVHFHEVGGIDAIVDIVGSFLGIEYLGIHEVYASKVPLGSGTVTCSHGMLPVPAPATVTILKGVPVIFSKKKMELVTPTGAAIITTLASEFGSFPDMVMESVGYGSGKKEPEYGLPNLLRIITGEACDKAAGKGLVKETLTVVETSIDDMSPEITGYLMEKLFEAGALDVCFYHLQMKKNRPGTRIEVLLKPDKSQEIIELILEETTSTGVRHHSVDRMSLKREAVMVDTSFGKLQAKQITDSHGRERLVPEYEVCKKVAKERNIPLKDLFAQLCLDMDQSRL